MFETDIRGVIKVSVLIPTYKRAHLLNYVLEALTKQTYRNFEVLVVLKPSGDATDNILEKYGSMLDIRVVLQVDGYFIDALNLGLENVRGDVVAFLDDDAIPFQDWIQTQVEAYGLPNVGGVAGDAITAELKHEKIIATDNGPQETVPTIHTLMSAIRRKLWKCPLKGLEDYFVYISKAGVVDYNSELAPRAKHQATKSLLGVGANMSVLSEAISNFRFPSSWVSGISNEQFLGWHLWKKQYNLFFDPKVKVYHLRHGQTLARDTIETRRETLNYIEHNLLFYRLYEIEPEFSKMHRITWLILRNLFEIGRICRNREIYRIAHLKCIFYSETIGVKWILSKRIGGHYTPLKDLERFL